MEGKEMKKGVTGMVWLFAVLLAVGVGVFTARAGVCAGEGTRFGLRVAQFDPTESGLDSKTVFGMDVWLSDKARLSVEPYSYSESGYDPYYGVALTDTLKITPVTLSWVAPSADGRTYYGAGLGWYTAKLTVSVSGYGSESVSDSDMGWHLLAGRKLGKNTFAEVKYSKASVTFNAEGESYKADVGGFTMSAGMLF
jgi:hypothetical protein